MAEVRVPVHLERVAAQRSARGAAAATRAESEAANTPHPRR